MIDKSERVREIDLRKPKGADMDTALFTRRNTLGRRPVALLRWSALCTVVWFQLFLGFAMTAEAEDAGADLSPPTIPSGEKAWPENLLFAETCLSKVNEIAAKSEWRLGAKLLTQSDRWGLILRIDFDIAGEISTSRVNRIICWQTPDGKLNIMYAIGQDVPRL
jgi:hypothetical protein